MEDLICPLTLEYFVTPITLPCCGKAVSKIPFLQNYEFNKYCPLCRHDLSNVNVAIIPMSVNLAYMVEQQLQEQNEQQTKLIKSNEAVEPICINIHRLHEDKPIYKTVIGKAKISGLQMSNHLVIIVVDISGSMAGNPMTNVKYSLNRIVDSSFKNRHLITQIVTYNDSASSFEIEPSRQNQQHYQNIITLMNAGGGTSFTAAFHKIEELFKKYTDKSLNNSSIGSISVVFLTDGEDSSVPKNKRGDLVVNLKNNLKNITIVPFTVHAIGFGGSHDFDFLNQLKDCGTLAGAYRYADPSENTDILSSKINSILDVVVTTNAVAVKILKSDIPIIFGDNGDYWVNLTGKDLTLTYNFEIAIDNNPSQTIIAKINNEPIDINLNTELWNQWFSYLVDEIAAEVILLNSSNDQQQTNLSKNIHCELICQRSRAIMVRAANFPIIQNRLTKLLEAIDTIKKGGEINQLKLTDMKFEGKFETKINSSATINSVIMPRQITYVMPTQTRSHRYNSWHTIKRPITRKCGMNEINKVIYQSTNLDAIEWLTQNSNSIDSKDLKTAASIGRQPLVETMLKYVNHDYSENYLNACDLAILFGYWKTAEILIDNGFRPHSNGQDLLRTCLSHKYFQTARLLVNTNIATVTDDMMDDAPNSSISNWISNNSCSEISIDTAIRKGLIDKVKSKIHEIDTISWQPYLDMLEAPSDDHIKVIDLLLTNKKASPFEVCNSDDGDVTWPLFIASKNGCSKLFDLLLTYQTTDTINMQNKKGTTALWIACCNKHIDIVMNLLVSGANPNLTNFKGDSALIPAIQKNSDTIVKILLEAGADLDAYNKNRDTPIIICCRLGQSKILEICLNHLSVSARQKALLTCADIDGFNPLIAAAEQDRVDCIRVCCQFGANLEFLTADDNSILPGATALHIASFYGKVASVKLLCELGANPLAKSTIHGYTALHIAIKQKHTNVVAYLMSTYSKELTTIADKSGNYPIVYAKMTGNESILEDYFTNKLELLMGEMIFSDNIISSKCLDVVTKYSKSLLCYEHDQLTNLETNQRGIATMALLTGKHSFAKYLIAESDSIEPMTMFWASYLNQDIGPPKPETQLMLDRVKNICTNNLQNKLLTNLSSVPELFDLVPHVLEQMTDGYTNTVNQHAIEQIKKSSASQHLLGFLERLKNNKIFPDGKKCLEFILWDAKVHMIELIANGETILQPIHLMSIYLYSSNMTIYRQVNSTINDWDSNSLWHPFVFCLYNAINLCPIYSGESYRAINHVFEPSKYMIGSKFTSGGFTMSSVEWGSCSELIKKKQGIIFIIKCTTGRNISAYSKFPVNSEIILLPGTEFVVTDIYVGNIFVLGQANIRKTSSRATEKDILKAANGESTIIIEVTETN